MPRQRRCCDRFDPVDDAGWRRMICHAQVPTIADITKKKPADRVGCDGRSLPVGQKWFPTEFHVRSAIASPA
ncbi:MULTISPECIES: hypothetical protein [Mycobacterium]|jgi:hypothetical protein|uniref:hypothetical protein n=1 Tax=Mycobacterium TaxID=1763 RepID=UPI0010554B28|nr:MULTISPECIES: hypothetical protein [Mycobacterium]